MDNRVAEGPWVMKYRDRYYMMYNANHTSTEWGNYQLGVAESDTPLGFQNGNKYSYPVLGSNQTKLEDNYVDLLRYQHSSYQPLFDYVEDNLSGDWTALSYNAESWKKGKAGFSSREVKGSTTRHLGTKWTTPALKVRKRFWADESTGNLALRVSHGGDTKIYLNGRLIYKKQGEDYCIVNLDKKQRAILKNGENLLAVETNKGYSNFLDVSLFDMKNDVADDILMTPGQPNIVRGPNGLEWWLIYMANTNNKPRSQYINRVQFFDKTLFVDGITGLQTGGYHPVPSLPTFSHIEETASLGVLNKVMPSVSYLFEVGVNTREAAGVIAWWKDIDNYVNVGLDAKNQCWYLLSVVKGKQKKQTFDLPKGFCWDVYHSLRIERDMDCMKVWLDDIPAPQRSCFTHLIPAVEPGYPGTFDAKGNALFAGITYTIGFDKDKVSLDTNSEMLLGEFLNDYEFSFQLTGLSDERVAGCYPVYVDKNNYVRAMFNGIDKTLDVTTVKGGESLFTKKIPLEKLQTIYPDIKYTDNIEKGYRFEYATYLNALYLNRHDVGIKAEFVNDMFSKFSISYFKDGKWFPIEAVKSEVSEHPAFNKLIIKPIKAEGLRFINREAEDLERHIYKLGIKEQLKESYHFRTVRRGDQLYLFVDGKELATFDTSYPSSRVGLCSENYSPNFNGLLYYHLRN